MSLLLPHKNAPILIIGAFLLCFRVFYFAQFAFKIARLSIISLGILSPKFSA